MHYFITRLTLDLSDSGAEKLIFDVQKLHAFVMSGFPRFSGVRVQFRVEDRSSEDKAADVVRITIRSTAQPRYPHEWSGKDFVAEMSIAKATAPPIAPGDEIRFELRANPIKAGRSVFPRRNKSVRRVKREAIADEAGALAWLSRKADSLGVEFSDCSVRTEGVIRGERYRDEMFTPLTFNSVLFTGKLRVDDPERLTRALIDGVGPGKGYGFGMLSIYR